MDSDAILSTAHDVKPWEFVGDSAYRDGWCYEDGVHTYGAVVWVTRSNEDDEGYRLDKRGNDMPIIYLHSLKDGMILADKILICLGIEIDNKISEEVQ